MIGMYSYKWEERRKMRRLVLVLVIVGLLIFALVPLANHVSEAIRRGVAYLLFGAWAAVCVTLFAFYILYIYWDCPRCGKPYHMKGGFFWRWINPFTRRCLHCGLPKWDNGPQE